MIAAAIVCAAAISHGAALGWGLTTIAQTPDGTGPTTGDVAYFMLASTWDEFSALTPDKVGKFCADNYQYTATVKVGARSTNVTADSGSYTPGEVISGYTVLFDNSDATKATNYAYTEVLTATVPDAGSPQLTRAFSTVVGGDWQPIPEPTSGLLLLIGVAGLALKRRRA